MSDESETVLGKEKKKSKVEKKSESHVQVMSDKKSEYYSYSSGDNADKDKKESPKTKKKKVTKFDAPEPEKKHERKIEIVTEPKFDVSEPSKMHERKIEIVMEPSEPDIKTEIRIPVKETIRVEEKLKFKAEQEKLKFKAEQEKQKQKEYPAPKPSKLKTEEMDFESKIPPFWKFRDIRPDESPTKIGSKFHRDVRPPTPPYQFDSYPKFDTTPKPIIEFPDSEPEFKETPMKEKRELPKIVPKQEPIVRAQPPFRHIEVERPPSPILIQEPPPEEGFIPPPKPFSNAVGVESTKITKIEDSSQFHKRFVQMEQTTRLIKLSGPTDLDSGFKTKIEKKTQLPKTDETYKSKLKETTLKEIPTFLKKPLPKLEAFPFTVAPSKPKKEKVPPPPTPKKFIKGEMRESDYDSDSDIRIKPIWYPPDSDAEDLSYCKVEIPIEIAKEHKRSRERTPTPPSVFDDKPPPTGEPMRPKVESIEVIKLREPSPEYIIPVEITLMEEKELAKMLATRQPSPPPQYRSRSPPISHPEEIALYKAEDMNIKLIPEETKTSPKSKKKPYREIIERTERKISDKEYKEERTYRTGKVEIIKTTVTELHKPEETDFRQSLDLRVDVEDSVKPIPLEYETSKKYEPKGLEEVSDLEPFPFIVEGPRPRREKGPTPRQPKKFIKGEMSQSGLDSDLDEKIPVLWKPPDSDADEPSYSKVEIALPRGRKPLKGERLPTPPSVFDKGPAESEILKLPLEKRPREMKLVIAQPSQQFESESEIYIPKPVKHIQELLISHEPAPKKEKIYLKHEPLIETKDDISIKSVPSQKRYDIDIDIVDVYDYVSETESEKVYPSEIGVYKSFQDLEPFPYPPEHPRPKRERGQPPPIPKKFIKGEMRESDYESEYEGKIPPKWGPPDSEGDELSYRKVKPPEDISKVATTEVNGKLPSPPSSFDFPPSFDEPPRPVLELHDIPRRERRESLEEYSIPKFPKVEFRPFDLEDEVGKKSAFVQTTDTETEPEGFREPFLRSPVSKKYTESTQKYVGEQLSDLNLTFRSKAQKFADQLVSEVFSGKEPVPSFYAAPEAPPEDVKIHTIEKPKEREENGLDVRQPQAYRDESRISEFGSKHIDPDSGLIYFKYDFGYEFGIVLPGEAKKIIRSKSVPPGGQNGDIEIPVIHERSDDESVSSKRAKLDRYQLDKEHKHQAEKIVPKKVPGKPRLGEPFSDSETETRLKRDFPYSTYKKSLPKFKSFGPPLPGVSIKPQQTAEARGPIYTLSSPSLVSSATSSARTAPPTFISTMKDHVSPDGDQLRLECIVKSALPTKVTWYKNGFLLKENYRCQSQFQNGVCRLILLHPHADDSGIYTCTVENALGKDTTSTSVAISPGEAS